MKTLLSFLLFSMVVLAQTNPDGYIGYPSIHFTPSTTYGSADYSEYYTMGNYDYHSKINYKIGVKYPYSGSLTVAAFYESKVIDYDFVSQYYFYTTFKVRGSTQTLGCTISYYFK